MYAAQPNLEAFFKSSMWFIIAFSRLKLRILPLVYSNVYFHSAPIQVFEIQTISSKWLTINQWYCEHVATLGQFKMNLADAYRECCVCSHTYALDNRWKHHSYLEQGHKLHILVVLFVSWYPLNIYHGAQVPLNAFKLGSNARQMHIHEEILSYFLILTF